MLKVRSPVTPSFYQRLLRPLSIPFADSCLWPSALKGARSDSRMCSGRRASRLSLTEPWDRWGWWLSGTAVHGLWRQLPKYSLPTHDKGFRPRCVPGWISTMGTQGRLQVELGLGRLHSGELWVDQRSHPKGYFTAPMAFQSLHISYLYSLESEANMHSGDGRMIPSSNKWWNFYWS